MNTLKHSLLIINLLILTACTTIGPAYTQPPPAPDDQAMMYFMRSSVGYGNFWSTVFSVDDVEMVSLYDQGYSWMHIKPGIYKISAGSVLNQNYLSFSLPVFVGKEYYIEYNQEGAGYNQVRNSVGVIDPRLGALKISDYSYQKAEPVVKTKEEF